MPRMSLKLSFAALLAVGTSFPALAQPADPQADARYQQQLQDYQSRQDQYQAQQQDYEDQSAAAQARRDSYRIQQDRYAQDRTDYQRQREDYDARYGAGAWERRYGYGYDYRRRHDDAYRPYASSPCERGRRASATTGGVIGALAGAAIGSNLAGRGDRTAGAVLGAVAGGATGAAIGSSTAHCDATGYWFSYDQTRPYRESAEAREGWRYDRDRRSGCRLAEAPAYVDGRTEDRYVRVCPDSDGRYRITG